MSVFAAEHRHTLRCGTQPKAPARKALLEISLNYFLLSIDQERVLRADERLSTCARQPYICNFRHKPPGCHVTLHRSAYRISHWLRTP